MNNLEKVLDEAKEKGKLAPFKEKFYALMDEALELGIRMEPIIVTESFIDDQGFVAQKLIDVRYDFSLMSDEMKAQARRILKEKKIAADAKKIDESAIKKELG